MGIYIFYIMGGTNKHSIWHEQFKFDQSSLNNLKYVAPEPKKELLDNFMILESINQSVKLIPDNLVLFPTPFNIDNSINCTNMICRKQEEGDYEVRWWFMQILGGWGRGVITRDCISGILNLQLSRIFYCITLCCTMIVVATINLI